MSTVRRTFAVRIAVCCLATLVAGGPTRARGSDDDVAEWAKAHVGELVELYRHFHQTPELSLHEEQTAARMAGEMKALGIEVTPKVGGHGVVGVLKNGAGTTLMLRTDMDALPVVEQTGLVYASKVTVPDESGMPTGVMHACAHDIHMTNLIGVARYLATHKECWSGTVIFVCQPAEEKGEGAKSMLDAGLFTRFARPDYAVALHVDSTLPTGCVGYRAGYSLANVDSVDITVKGRGGHGAYPHTTIDPIVQAARLILDLQTIVSREIDPINPAVVTVGSIHGGAKHNVIADTCHLQLTVRSYKDEVRQQIMRAIRRKAEAAADAAGAPAPEVEFSEGTPAVHNDPELAERVAEAFRRALGADKVIPSEPSMGGEDFSRYGLAGVPAFMYRLGSVDAKRLEGYARVGQPAPSLHSGVYYPDAEPTLVTGIVSMVSAVRELMPPAR